MKLRTELIIGDDDGRHAFVNGSEDEMERDAMAAHALLQAMEVVLTDPAYCAVSRKAADILASWGAEQEMAG